MGQYCRRKKEKRPVVFWLNKRNLLVLAALLVVGSGAGLLMLQQKKSNDISLEANDSRQQGAEKAMAPAVVKNAADENSQDGKEAVSSVDTNDNSNIQSTTTNQNADAATNDNEKKSATYKPVNNRLSVADKTNTDNANNLFRNKDKKNLAKRSRTTSSQRVALADNVTFDQHDNTAASDDPLQEEFYIPGLQGSRERITIASLADWNNKQTIIKAIKIPDCPAAEKDAAGNKSYFEVYLSPDYAIKKYSDTGNSALIGKRKESLRFQSAYSAGIRYTRVFNNGMSIRAGINYSQINEKFSFIKDNVVQLVYVISPAGDTTDRYYVRGTRYKTSYNHYRTIDVPIVVGYELGNGRLHANINAGVMLNVYSWQKGETLDNNYMPVSITTGKEGDAAYQYKTNVGIGFTGAVSLYYKLNDRLHLLAEPYCRFNLSPMNKEAVSLQEKFTTIGLRLGLRVDF
ncbi:MAG: hypothetical protein IPP72_13215 [Chitinophagaceae bacterium]|nr:hypothetical protein [Chitinophagaceae bacterium]